MKRIGRAALAAAMTAAGAARPITPDDIARFATVSDPQVDPSGDWVAYAVGTTDLAADKGVSHLWMLTDYLIASDTRFKAAVSGASIGNALAGWGTDQYVRDYVAELGLPWANTAVWMKQSYPFYHNDRIVTPTLFMGGDKDFNVPLINSEQLYQSLRYRGIDTELVIYPGQFHGLKRPSFLKDRMERWLAWYDQRVK